MGSSASKQLIDSQQLNVIRSGLDAVALSKLEAELVYRSMNNGWYGVQPSKQAVDITPPASPLYDSDDEPTEPSGVVNALAVSAPPLSSRKCSALAGNGSTSNGKRFRSSGTALHFTSDDAASLGRTAMPHPHMILARTASAAAAFAGCPASTNSSTAAAADVAFYPAAAALRRSSSGGSSSSGSGASSSSKHRPRSGRGLADEASQHTSSSTVRYSSRNPFAGQTVVRQQYRSGGAAVVLPLSSVLLPEVNGGSKATQAIEKLSLITNRCSDADPNLRPYHHLHLMQIRKHQHGHHHHDHQQQQQQQLPVHHQQKRQQQQHAVACAQLPVQQWFTPPHANMAEVAS